MDKIAALSRFKHTINAEIRNHNSRVAALKDLGADDADVAKKSALEEEINCLELMLEEYKLERIATENDLTWKGDKLRAVQAQLNALLEDSWTNALLLEPKQDEPKVPSPEYNLQAEYQAFRQKMQNASGTSFIEEAVALDTSKDHLRVEASAQEAADIEKSRQLHQAACDAYNHLEAAQAAFDRRGESRFAAEQVRHADIERGEPVEDDTSETFDIRWCARIGSMTRELIEAERAYDEAQEAMAVFESEHRDPADNENTAEDDQEEKEYHTSSQEEVAATTPCTRILAWLAGVPEESTLTSPTDDETSSLEADEWDVAEIDFGDGISEILLNRESAQANPFRTQIDKWHKMQWETAAEFEWMRE